MLLHGFVMNERDQKALVLSVLGPFGKKRKKEISHCKDRLLVVLSRRAPVKKGEGRRAERKGRGEGLVRGLRYPST